MHEILIISGKGGTGKTSLAAAFAHLSTNAVLCDLDVDAPDLHLVLQPALAEPTPFVSGFEARIAADKCTQCGKCREMCRFKAVREDQGIFAIDPIRCEGCGVCVKFCPAQAVTFEPKQCGEWRISSTRFGPLVHAQLYPGEENSGRLVALLRHEAKNLAQSRGAEFVISDGPPGIGCPVISAISGQEIAVLVTEPTPSGHHDLQRVEALCSHFNLSAVVIINKCDLNVKVAGEIRAFCRQQNRPVIAELPHDTGFVQAVVQGLAMTEYNHQGETARALRSAWEKVIACVESPRPRTAQAG